MDADAYLPDGCAEVAIGQAFAVASEWVRTETGRVDGFLQFGSLDCKDAIFVMEQAFGRRGDGSVIWPTEEVAQMAELADWPELDRVAADERWAYWSARKFVEVCVANQLGIWFN